MPKLPGYETRVSAQGGPLGAGPVGDIGGGALMQAGMQIQNDMQRVEARERTRTITNSMSELRLASEQGFIAAQDAAKDGAEGFTPEALKTFDEQRNKIAAKISDRRAREDFLEHADVALREPFAERAINFEHEQGIGMRLTQADQSLQRTLSAVELAPASWVEAGMEAMRNIDSIGLNPAAEAEARAKATSAIQYAAARGMAAKDPAASLKKLSTTESGDPAFDQLGPDARKAVETYAKQKLADNSAQGVLGAYRKDARAGSQALVALGNSDLPADIKSDAVRQVREGVGMIHAERREQYGEQVTDLERRISLGTPARTAEAEATSLYHRGAYTADQYTNVLQAIDASRVKGAKETASVASFELAVASGARLDPEDSDVRKAADTWFKQGAAINHMLPGSNEWVNAAAGVAMRTNILPDDAMSWARRSLLSGEPALSVPAAQAMTRWSDAAPAAYAYFDDPNIKAFAEQVDGLVRAGVPSPKATEIAHANVYEMPKERREQMAATYRKEKYIEENQGDLQERLDEDDAFDQSYGPGGAPAPSKYAGSGARTMREEYEMLVRSYYDKTGGNIEGARELAWKDIRGTYGYSTINGKPEVLKYAPELMFPGIDSTVIRADIDEALKPLKITTPVRLVPSRLTGDTKGLMWELHTTDAAGNEETLLDEKNRPRIYQIPTDTSKYKAAQDAMKTKAIAAARQESELRRITAEHARNMDPLKNEFLP